MKLRWVMLIRCCKEPRIRVAAVALCVLQSVCLSAMMDASALELTTLFQEENAWTASSYKHVTQHSGWKQAVSRWVVRVTEGSE